MVYYSWVYLLKIPCLTDYGEFARRVIGDYELTHSREIVFNQVVFHEMGYANDLGVVHKVMT
jgi:hypothetical protein